MTKTFFKLKKPYFWPIFWSISPILGAEKVFQEKGSIMHNFIMVSSTIPKLKKTNDPIPRKYPDRRKDRQKVWNGEQTRPYFIGPFWLSPGVQQVHLR